MVKFGSQEDFDNAIASLQQWLDRGCWQTNEREARWIYDWYVWLANQGANIRNFDAPLEFWIGVGDLQLDDNFDTQAVGGNDQPAFGYDNNPGRGDDQPGSSRYPTIQGTNNYFEPTDYNLQLYDNWDPITGKIPYEGHSGGLDDKRGTSAHQHADDNNDQPEPSQYPTLRRTEHYYLIPRDDNQAGGADGLESEEEEEEFHPEDYYHINLAEPPAYARKFNTERKHYTVGFKNTEELRNTDTDMVLIFDSIMRDILSDFTPNDSTGLQINHPALDRPIYIPLTKHSNLNGYKILYEIMRVMQSNTELAIDDDLEIRTVSVRPPNGSGWMPRPINFDDWFEKSHSKIRIINNDDLCMARAIVTALANKRRDPKCDSINVGDQGYNTSMQKRLAQELMEKAGLADHKGSCGIPEAIAMQTVIKNENRLKIFAHDQQAIIFVGDSDNKSDIYLYLKDGHYDVITSMTGFFNKSYWCTTCDKGYIRLVDHKCKNTCSGCFRSPPCPNNDYIVCSECNRYFFSQQCFETHKKKYTGYVSKGQKKRKTETSICDRYKHCNECGQFIKEANKKEHVCNSFECSTCKKPVVKGEHKCYMQPIANLEEYFDINDDNDNPDNAGQDLSEAREATVTKYVFFDFETSQCVQMGENEQGPILKHVPTLCIAQTVCEKCQNIETNSCRRCGPREIVFKGNNCLDDFCNWLFKAGTKKCPVIAMAHNAKGFDGQFILAYLEKQGKLQPKIIDKGLEIMSLEAGHVKIMDSLNFLPMALDSLPKSFGIEELAKGYFPHLFNRSENWDYIGAWPEAHYYAPDSMKESKRKEFEIWYAKQTDKIFDFNAEIIKYCRSDVNILRRGILKFRDIFIEKTGVEPFDHSLTIASACNRVYCTLFLKPNTIGIIPHGGYRTKQHQSITAIKWLKWLSKTRNIRIEHARNGGEFRVEPHKFLADGRYGNEIFEFNGCYWHGCPTCMSDTRQRTAEQQLTAGEAYTRTVCRRRDIEFAGFTVTEIWECELNRQLKANPEMKAFFDNINIVAPMVPREAFFGGRTNAVRLYASAEKDEEGRLLEHIQYTDICSLYPYICKYGRFPTGHPEIITENFENLADKPYEGLIKCKVVPPRRLLHPVLPYRSNGKLTFPLCAICADDMQNEPCTHSDEERSITGSWVVTLEIYKALELGYRVTEIYEVYHYENVSEYNPETKTGGLFAEYTNMFVKMKQQADGWPSWAQTEADKRRYIDEYFEHEGIQLEKDSIAKNLGLCSLSKLMLNSFWGKFGQRNNKRKAEYFKDPAQYFKRLSEPGRIIHSIRIINEHMVRVVSSMQDDFVEVLGNTNTVIAAYTTAQARLKLYSYIERLGDRLIYFDTDSIIFKNRLNDPHEYRVPTGSYLGDMTNELKDYGEGAYIEEFVSSGPKCYAMKIRSPKHDDPQYIVKAKGFSLTSGVARKINFDSFKELVYKYVLLNVTEKVSVNFNQIARFPDHCVVTKSLCKDYRVVYTKRVVQSDFSTLPYGY